MSLTLTKREREVLEWLAADRTNELLRASPGGWWMGNERVAGSIGFSLLYKALIRTVGDSTPGYTHYVISDRGMAALAGEEIPPLS